MIDDDGTENACFHCNFLILLWEGLKKAVKFQTALHNFFCNIDMCIMHRKPFVDKIFVEILDVFLVLLAKNIILIYSTRHYYELCSQKDFFPYNYDLSKKSGLNLSFPHIYTKGSNAFSFFYGKKNMSCTTSRCRYIEKIEWKSFDWIRWGSKFFVV